MHDGPRAHGFDPPPPEREGSGRLYLDQAATTFPKPHGVAAAMARWASGPAEPPGASPGRGGYAEARRAAGVISECRRAMAALLGVSDPDRIAFTLNATDAINLAIRGVVSRALRDHPSRPVMILTTDLDHNAAHRPLHALSAREPRVSWRSLADAGELALALDPSVTLCVASHASNVTGEVQPIAPLGAACRAAGVPLLLDAAQTIGRRPIQPAALGADMVAFSGHKHAMGPLGTGGLWVDPGMDDRLDTAREGGTGTHGELESHPASMPHKLEAGSPNLPGLAGLLEGARWVAARGLGAVADHEHELGRVFLEALGEPPGLALVRRPGDRDHLAIFSFVHDRATAHEVAAALEAEFGVLTRSGLHCAPIAHAALRSPPGGAVRLSFGPMNTADDAARAARALAEVAQGLG